MREIKFRGKVREGEQKGEWAYGGILHYGNGAGEHSYIVVGSIFADFVEVENKTVGQYTGLKDKNDVKILEGDIVKFTYWWFDGRENDSILTGEIVYLPESMSFGLRGVKNNDWIRHIGDEEGTSDTILFAFLNFDEADFEVIGNIHDNPELLEENNAENSDRN